MLFMICRVVEIMNFMIVMMIGLWNWVLYCLMC